MNTTERVRLHSEYLQAARETLASVPQSQTRRPASGLQPAGPGPGSLMKQAGQGVPSLEQTRRTAGWEQRLCVRACTQKPNFGSLHWSHVYRQHYLQRKGRDRTEGNPLPVGLTSEMCILSSSTFFFKDFRRGAKFTACHGNTRTPAPSLAISVYHAL